MNKFITIETNYGNIELELFADIAPKTVSNFIGLAEGSKEWFDNKSNSKVKKPFYNGLIFHRVIKDFMIQGGCPEGTGTGGPGYSFEDECYEEGEPIIGKISDDNIGLDLFNQIIAPYLGSNPNPDKEVVEIANKCVELQSVEPLKAKPIEYYLEKTGNHYFNRKGKLKASVDFGTICMANSGPNTNGSQFFIVTKKDGCDWLNGNHTVFGKVIKGMEVVQKIENLPKNQNDKPIESSKATINRIIIK